jgi:putative ABC transport system permease protein
MAAFRSLGRIARRSLLRDRWRALLVVVLIGLPVMGIATSALVLKTALPTSEERATREMGSADLRVEPNGSFGRTELAELVPPGSTIEPIWSSGDRVVIDGVRESVSARNLDPNGIAAGMVTMLDGRPPAAADEIAVSEQLATLAGARIGDTLSLEDVGTVRIVGRFEDPRNLTALAVVGDPALAEANDRVPIWLVDLPSGSSPTAVGDLIATTIDPAFENTGQPMFNVLTRAQAGEATDTFVTLIVVLGSLALVEAALVASASFAVGIRRRQRELGLLGAAGATPRQLAGSVLAEGLVAGLAAVVTGIGAGLAVAWLVSLRLDELAGARTGGLELDPGVLLVAGLVGLLAALVAAAVPAWGAARLPSLVALSGRRPPSTPARRLLAVGVGLIAIAVACTLVAPMVGRLGDTAALMLMVVGAVTGVLGFGACSPWLLERMEGVARRLPLAPRVALRDTSRARTRNGPIVTAVLASVAATIALAAILASAQAQTMLFWQPAIASDSLVVHGEASERAGARIAQELNAVGAGPDRTAFGPDGTWYYTLDMPLLRPEPENDLFDTWIELRIGDESLLLAHHGDAALDAFRAGATVVLQAQDAPVTGSTGTVQRTDETTGSTRVADTPVVIVPARADTTLPTLAVMPEEIADSLGLDITPGPYQYLVRLDHDVTDADVARAGAIATSIDANAYVQGPLPPSDPMVGFRLLMLAGALAAALTVTGIAVALGEAEARTDQRTLLALGAPRGLRRRITASRALVIAALAGLLAVPAGLLPVWGVLVPLGWPVVVPIPEVIAALLVLPVAAVAGGLLLGRPLPEWAARRDAAS